MSKTHMVVLGVLSERPMYAYEFKEIIEERGYEHWGGIQMRSIYKAMESLNSQGYLESQLKVHSNTQNVKIYEVTDKGYIYLKKLVEKAFYNRKGTESFWLAVAFMFATTRDFALQALQDRKKQLLIEREQDEEWINKIDNNLEYIPSNYQGLIKMGYEMSFIVEKRMDEWVQNLKDGKEEGFFAGEEKLKK